MLIELTQLQEIKPALSGYIREAQQMLDPAKVPDDKTVHDVRVFMKKARATLKLLKEILDKDTFKREYDTLREVGRIMRSWRETSVHRKLLKSLKKKYPAVFKNISDDSKIKSLLGKQHTNDQADPDIINDIKKIKVLLHKSLYRLRFIPFANPEPYRVFSELENTYTGVSHSYLNARIYPKSTNLHEFRKRVKDFLYQLVFFRSLNPKTVKSLEKRLDSLGKNLGRYNDIAVLTKTLDYGYKPGESNDAIDDFVLIMKQEQDRYLSKIWPSSYRIFRPGRKLKDTLQLKSVAM